MKYRLYFLVILILSACGKKESTNLLTYEQGQGGWKLLFDGKTMNGWRTFQNKENDTWEVLEGTLHCKPMTETTGIKRDDLLTDAVYGNFELAFDWKLAFQSNSGLVYRVTEEFNESYASGPEYQIIDDIGYPGELKPENKTGGCYGMYVPAAKKMNPVGEWNSSKIMVNGNHVEHWLNGGKIVEYELGSDDWKQKVENGKWKDFPGYGLAATGHIDLQDHGNEVWFRNIMIKEL